MFEVDVCKRKQNRKHQVLDHDAQPRGIYMNANCGMLILLFMLSLPCACSMEGLHPDGGNGPDSMISDQAVQSDVRDQGTTPDLDVARPDLGPPILLQGSFGLMGPSTGSKYILLEGSFEQMEPVCSAKYCVTGGIMP